MLRPMLLAAAVLAGAPDLPPPTRDTEGASRPVPEDGRGGPYESVPETEVVVEGEPAELVPAFTIAPDPALERRYAPRERAPLNRVTLTF